MEAVAEVAVVKVLRIFATIERISKFWRLLMLINASRRYINVLLARQTRFKLNYRREQSNGKQLLKQEKITN